MNNYVIGVAVKGKNVVLKEIDTIKKAGAKLSKAKFTANLAAKTSAEKVAAAKVSPSFDSKKFVSEAKEAGVKAHTALGNAMSGGASGVANALPWLGIGALFSASQSAIGSAAQEFISGITASKNIQLVEANFKKAFGGALDGAFKGTMFSSRATQAVYSNLAEQGVKTSTLAKPENVKLLDQFARAQGVGSLDELFSRMQSGQLKEGAGLGKGDIEFLKSSSQMLNNRYSADIGMQTILQTLKSRQSAIDEVAGSAPIAGELRRDKKGKLYRTAGLANTVRAEGNIRESEERYQETAASTLGVGGYEAMKKDRLSDLKIRAKTLGTGIKINQAKIAITEGVIEAGEDLAGGKKMTLPGVGGILDKIKDKALAPSEAEAAPGGGEDMRQGPQSGGGGPSDINRAGAALADTLNQITRQLQAIQYQFRTRGN